jgi:hypothetical protein
MLSVSGYGQAADCCECGNEHSGSIKCAVCRDYLRKYYNWIIPKTIHLCLYENSLHAATNEVITNRMGEQNCVYNKIVVFAGIVFRIIRLLDCVVTISFGYILYCGCFNLFCNVLVCVCVGFVVCGCFGSMCSCIYCVLYCLYCVFLLFRLCIFILICFVCVSVRITVTEWLLNCNWWWWWLWWLWLWLW